MLAVLATMPRGTHPAYRTPAIAILIFIAALSLGFGVFGARRACSVVGPGRSRAIGIGLILMVVVLWTSSSVVIQLLFEEAHFRQPFFLTWYNLALLVVYLPFYPNRLEKLRAALQDEWFGAGRHLSSTRGGKYAAVTPTRLSMRTDSREDSVEDDDDQGYGKASPTAALGTALRLGVLFFLNQLCFNLGLEMTTMSTVTVIAASSGLWTLLFSAVRLRERVGPIKLLSTLLTFCGVMLVVFASDDSEYRPLHHGHHRGGSAPPDASNALWGNGATLLSALLYGAYAAQLKHEVPSEEDIPMPYLFGLIGLVVTTVLLPLIPILHVLRLERFALPSRYTLLALTVNGLLGSVVSNMLLARAMILASPLVATVGLSLSIPLAIGADALRGRGHFAEAAPILGTAAVWCGFLGVSAADELESRCCKSTRVGDAQIRSRT